jgi:hypothetical protein
MLVKPFLEKRVYESDFIFGRLIYIVPYSIIEDSFRLLKWTLDYPIEDSIRVESNV